MRFVDEARLRIEAGNGGDGCAAFLREKYRPKGGPSGGDGGRGGNVVAFTDPGLSTLADTSYKRILKAERGHNGSGKNRHGPAGEDLVVRLPPGTLVIDADSDTVLADLCEPNKETLLAVGGQGGRGNARFATPTNQAPRRADAGTLGEKYEVRLELQLLADAGLVGLPNAGKSSLLSHVSKARPKVADYPFTTLIPHLGVVSWAEERSFVLADIPGLIRGAHQGQGLGDRFLRHLRRTAMLVHLVDASDTTVEQALKDFDTINEELTSYDEGLGKRNKIVVLTKMDLPGAQEICQELTGVIEERGFEVHAISSATGQGLTDLIRNVGHKTEGAKEKREAEHKPTNDTGP